MKYCTYIFLYLILFCSHIRGQDDIFFNISTDDGLSQRWIMASYQDRYGFMWFGTKDGLNFYDGYSFRQYRYESETSGLPSSTVNFILEDNRGTLWVGTDRGACYYDRENDAFIRVQKTFPRLIEHILQTSADTFWFATQNGLLLYNRKLDRTRNFRHQPENDHSLCNDVITCLLEDNNGNLWVGTREGLCIMKDNDTVFSLLNPSVFGQSHIFDLYEDPTGRIWISDYHKGLFVFIENNQDYSDRNFHFVIPGQARALQVDHNRRLWLSWGQKMGVSYFELDSFDMKQMKFRPGTFGSKLLLHYSIDNMYCDRNNNIWMGTYDRGLFFTNTIAKRFYRISEETHMDIPLTNYIINALYKDGDKLWIGTEWGLNCLNTRTGKVKNYNHDPENKRSLASDPVYAIRKDSFGRIWIGNWNGGLHRYNPETNDFTHIDPPEWAEVLTENIFSILEVRPGVLWLGTVYTGGLVEYDTRNKTFINLSERLNVLTPDVNHSVPVLIMASDGTIWIGSDLGVFHYNPVSDKFTFYGSSPDKKEGLTPGMSITLYEDIRKNIWVANEGGLNCYLPGSGSFRHFTISDGLPSNFINGILDDSAGNLWISTNQGLVKFIRGSELPDTAEFLIYTRDDGLSSLEFTKNAAFKGNDGRLYFGGINGITFFSPDSIFKNPLPPQVRLTNLYIWNEKVIPGKKGSVLSKPLYLVDGIRLKHNQNMFVVEFTALNFLNSTKNRFAYYLEGYDEKWFNSGGNRIASYTNLDPGTYTLWVKACNNDGVWNEEGVFLKIKILPPWYETTIARLTFIFLIIGLLFLIYTYRVRQYKNRQLLLEKNVKERTQELEEVNFILTETREEIRAQNEELREHRENLRNLVEKRTRHLQKALKKAEESDRLKSSFLANMSHEIRTPMNAIVGFTTLLMRDKLNKKTREHYHNLINSNTDALLVLIDDILDLSLIEADQLIIEIRPFDIDKLFTRLEETFKLKNPKNLDIEYVNTDRGKSMIIHGDAVRLGQCLNNLIGNAMKFTEVGYVRFGFKVRDEELHCFVEDTGIGVEKDKRDKIFEYFYKDETNIDKLYRGTGLGLAITRRLTEIMGGRVWLDSKEGRGSLFQLVIPVGVDNNLPKTPSKEMRNKAKVSGNLENLVILVAEDEPANLTLIREVLKTTEAEVKGVENGKLAVEYVKNFSGKKNLLVLMDIKMPVMDGITALKEIRKEEIDVTVIALTAHANRNDRRRLLEAGFDDYISKPINVNELLDIIKLNMPSF